MNTAIITGGSRGLGRSLVETYCKNDYQVISIARKKSLFKHPNLINEIEYDLSDTGNLTGLVDEMMSSVDSSEPGKIILIHNAGIVGEAKSIHYNSAEVIEQVLFLNLHCPIIMASLIIKRSQGKDREIRIINISSQSAVSAIAGWTPYCTSKAGLEMATRTIAEEQRNNPKFKISAIRPGIIDTDMQVQIRSAKKEDFRDVDRFIEFKKEGILVSPQKVAEKIYFLIQQDKYVSGEILDVKDVTLSA